MAKCIITGCDLIDLDYPRWVHGDLWKESGCYIFNACLEGGETAWQYEKFPTDEQKVIRISSTNARGSYTLFERRGVLVFYDLRGELNQAARDYLK